MTQSFTSQESVADFCPEHIDTIDPKILEVCFIFLFFKSNSFEINILHHIQSGK